MFKRGLVLLWMFAGATMALAQEGALSFPDPVAGAFDEAELADIDLNELPVIPEWTATAQAVYEAGQAAGNIAQRFSKVGDCMTASERFLMPFATENYDLGEYDDLQSVIEHFSVPARDEDFALNSFANPGLATQSGFNTASLTDALFADPKWCDITESPLTCEYRVSRPAFSLMMLGTNDVMFFEAADFDFAMRSIVVETLRANIVPVLYTFPIRPEFPEKTDTFNRIIADIARDYDLPLVNLWLAIYDLPFNGVDEAEPIHLSLPADGATGVLTEEGLTYGYNMRNLITLQALDTFLKAIADAQS